MGCRKRSLTLPESRSECHTERAVHLACRRYPAVSALCARLVGILRWRSDTFDMFGSQISAGLRFHSLRPAYSSPCAAVPSISVRQVAEWMGHATPTTTEIVYTRRPSTKTKWRRQARRLLARNTTATT